ncbi:MAG TPA: hypothetical protein VGQ35_15715 [Dongiaceae bacterium]|jgi:hypothetical protein|nr:hypothetical protein [Dongiaceae bacterium]
MDIAAAAQISGAQRTQQSALNGIKSAQVQAQSLISMLTEATTQTAQTQVAAQPVNSTGGTTDGATADKRLPRGSLVNILA